MGMAGVVMGYLEPWDSGIYWPLWEFSLFQQPVQVSQWVLLSISSA